jgi:hypothetical protein
MALRALQGPAGGAAPVGGSGTIDTIPRWTGATTLGDSPLTVSGSNVTGAGAIRATGTTAGAPAFTGADTDTGVYFPAANQMRFSTAGSLAISIDASQNVGIGVIPSAWASSVRAEEMRTHARWNYNSGSDSVAYWTVNAFLNSAGNPIYKATAAASQYTQIGGAHVWERAVSGTAGNTVTWLESARIDSNGNVGIGVTPISPLHVKGNATNTDGILTLTPNTGGRNHQVQSLQASSLFRIFDQSAGASRLEIDINGNISAATTGGTFNASTTNAGIKLPATPGNADTQTLDCYQENAAWTPVLTGFGGTAPTVFASTCTRIGRMVICNIVLTATGGNTYSASYATTTISLPVASAALCAATLAQGTNQVPNATVSSGNILVPTFALTTVATVITATYYV